MIDGQPDIAKVVNLTRRKGTGPVRVQRPVYVDSLTPCNAACPAGEEYPSLARTGTGGTAQGSMGFGWWRITRFPPCTAVCATTRAKSNCNRRELDGAVRIHAVERFSLATGLCATDGGSRSRQQPFRETYLDRGCRARWAHPAAYHLRRLGHEKEVEISRRGSPLPAGCCISGRFPALSTSQGRPDREKIQPELKEYRPFRNSSSITKSRNVLQEQAAGAFDAVIYREIGAHSGESM